MTEYGYEVQGNPDEGVVSVLCSIGELTDRDGKVIAEENESRLFFPGSIVPESEIAQHIIKSYADGEEHATSIFKRVPIVEEKVVVEAKPEPSPKVVAKVKPTKTQSVK